MIVPADILKASLLIVDDQEANVLLLEEMLRSAGYGAIASTREPREVCELHRKNRYDLILLDLQMPGLDGFQVMEDLKKIETDGYLPVLVITAQPGHKLRALKGGAKDFVSKPFELAEVLIRVYNMLEVRLLHLETKRLYSEVVAAQKVSAQRLLIFRSGPDAVSITTVADGRIIDANEQHCKFFGYAREELVGRSVTDGNLWADPEERDRVMERLLKEGAMRGFEAKLRRRSGEVRDVLASVELIELAGEIEPVAISMFTDITERKQVAEALHDSEEFFSKAFWLSEDCMVILRAADRTVIKANQAACDLWGTTREEVVGKSTQAYSSWLTEEERLGFMQRLKENGECLDYETTLRMNDGRLVELVISSRAITLDGEACIWSAMRDVSARRKAEEAVRELQRELEQRVIQRTAELEASNKELEAFSYSVSHDLRAPLRAVDGFSQAVLEDFGGQLPEEGRRYLKNIRSGAQQMGALIDDLLEFAQLSRQGLNKRLIDTSMLVRGALNELGSPWPGRQVEIRIGELPASFGDPGLLKQVWLNILSNALKYTRKREKTVVEISCVKVKGVETFSVHDNGTGFDKRYAEKLFGVFQRLHRAEDYEGTGVGLAIVQRIVHRHGGRVWADSVLDLGATFYFTLDKQTSS